MSSSTQSLQRPKSSSNTFTRQNTNNINNNNKNYATQHSKTSSSDQVSKKDRNKDRPRSVSSSGISVAQHNNRIKRPSSVGSSERLNTASSCSRRTTSSRPPSCGSYGSLRRFNSEERMRSTVCIYTGSSGLLRHQQHQGLFTYPYTASLSTGNLYCRSLNYCISPVWLFSGYTRTFAKFYVPPLAKTPNTRYLCLLINIHIRKRLCIQLILLQQK